MDISKLVSIFLEIVMAIFTILTYFKIDPTTLPQEIQIIFIIPWYVYAIIFVIILVAILPRPEKRKLRVAAAATIRKSAIGGEFSYNDVNWDIRVPVPSQFESPDEYDSNLPNAARIETPPKCPQCGIELEEKKNLFFGYTWNCIGCKSSKRSKESFSDAAEKVKKFVKRDCENGTLCHSMMFSNTRNR